MIDIDIAMARIRQHLPRPDVVSLPLEEAVGHVLAADVVSDIDSPPHDKSLVDGYAVVCSDLPLGDGVLRVLEEVAAGEIPRRRVTPGWATRIMTGAPIPAGADAVVMLEHTETVRGSPLPRESSSDERRSGASELGQLRVPSSTITRGQFILRQAECLRKGDRILPTGHVVRAVDLGLLAECGSLRPLVYRRPRVASLQTGNELVPVSQQPGPGQIRNSNGPMIRALIAGSGGIPLDLGVARDEQEDLSSAVEKGIEADLLVVSGGVSAGDRDLVPGALIQAGVTEVFHQVRLRPGKPIWFGVAPGGTLVFGLPGNPVSSLVCFLLFVAPAVAHLAGRPSCRQWPPSPTAVLATEHELRDPRPTLWPSVRQVQGDLERVVPLSWRGSADLRALGQANCLAFFAEGNRIYPAGERVPLLGLD
jgi:molybdopterin molybdotransferase